MTDKQPDMRRDALLFRAVVAKEHRPTSSAEIERLLAAVPEEPLDASRVERILLRANGVQDDAFEEGQSPNLLHTELSEEELSVAVLCRAKGKPLPEDLAAKVKALEAKA